jgi:hypothetical protein
MTQSETEPLTPSATETSQTRRLLSSRIMRGFASIRWSLRDTLSTLPSSYFGERATTLRVYTGTAMTQRQPRDDEPTTSPAIHTIPTQGDALEGEVSQTQEPCTVAKDGCVSNLVWEYLGCLTAFFSFSSSVASIALYPSSPTKPRVNIMSVFSDRVTEQHHLQLISSIQQLRLSSL